MHVAVASVHDTSTSHAHNSTYIVLFLLCVLSSFAVPKEVARLFESKQKQSINANSIYLIIC